VKPFAVRSLAVLAAIGWLLAGAVRGAAAEPAGPMVKTSLGAVRGTGGRVESFKGIPYAAPPTGPLRWRAPQPAAAWTGVRDATRFGHDCMQTPYVIPTGQTPSEDCLHVDVWRPRGAMRKPRPVMVYIYGGAFIGGSTAYPLYDPAKLTARGVIVVSVSYRVGIFGFLAHPMLSAESPQHVSGDYGLLDQIAALRWVRANIAAFGGDPGRVTVFGESAGASSIAFLMTSPLAKGLFQQAIMQSTALMPLPSLASAEKAGAALAPDIATLRAMSANDLLKLNTAFSPQAGGGPSFPKPVADGYVLPLQPRKAFETGAFTAVPTIIGYNADEGRMTNDVPPDLTVDGYRARLKRLYGDRAGDFLRLDPAADDAGARKAAISLFGDNLFNEGSRLVARSVASREPKTFSYLFTRSVGGAGPPPTHSEELAYVFGTLTQPAFVKHAAPNTADWALSRQIQAAWARFAATGDPNGPGLPVWPAYGPSDPYLELGVPIRAGAGHRKAQLDLMKAVDDAQPDL
jgi:carboxylesterase type B